jgi:hypothetical protein
MKGSKETAQKKLSQAKSHLLSQAKSHYWQTYGEHLSKTMEEFRKWSDYDDVQLEQIAIAAHDLLHAMAYAEEMLLEGVSFQHPASPPLIVSPFAAALGPLRTIIYPLVKPGPEDVAAQQELYSKLEPGFLHFVILPHRPGPEECISAARMRSEGLNVVLLAPDDIDALGSALWTLNEMLEYKMFRIFLQGGVDADAVYSDWQVEKFRKEIMNPRATSRLQPIRKAIEARREDSQHWVKHPKFDNLDYAVRNNDLVFVLGESASGKSTLALDYGVKHEIRGSRVFYTNIATLTEQQGFQIGILFFKKFLMSGDDILLILDDLHCRPEIGRNLLGYFQLIQHTAISNNIRVLALCWPSYIDDFREFQRTAVRIIIEAADIKDKLIAKFGAALTKTVQSQILDFAENDLLILRLLLDLAKHHNVSKDYSDLAQEVWKHRSHELQGDLAALTRTVLVVSSLGQYECDVPEIFLRTQAGTSKEQLKELRRAKILIRRGDRYSLPHRSFARLLADYLTRQRELWNWFRSRNGPSNVAELIFNYMQFLDPSEVWNVLELINKTGGISVSRQSQQDAKFIIECWKRINTLLRKIYDQQNTDPTWGHTISSATFACEALSAVGKKKEAQGSIKYLREVYRLDRGRLTVDVSKLSTVKDFVEIRACMNREERVQSYVRTYSLETADSLNVNLLHENWASGLILCAEAAMGELDRDTLQRLAESVEARVEEGGYFYPSRVPWCTARVLMGLGRCGRNVENSEVVRRVASWLMQSREERGAREGPSWDPGTGTWNTKIETTAMCLTALRDVGVSAENPILVEATNWLFQQRKRWKEIGGEVDGAIAIESYLKANRDWRDVADPITYLSWWADGQAVWLYATESSEKTHLQSCRVAQVAAFMITAMWSILRNDLPSLLTALGLYQTADSNASSVPRERPYLGPDGKISDQRSVGERTGTYDIALSYAEEDRKYVERVAHCLIRQGIKVFYDRFEQVDMWGKDLYAHFDEVYRKRAKFCVIFLSAAYATKAWTNQQRRSAQARAFQENQEYILPVRMDDTEVPGISPLIGYINRNDYTPSQLCRMIIAKLQSTSAI